MSMGENGPEFWIGVPNYIGNRRDLAREMVAQGRVTWAQAFARPVWQVWLDANDPDRRSGRGLE